MEEKKINLLYDATLLAENYTLKNSNRTGVFLASYNILREMLKNPQLNITLYVDNSNLIPISLYLQNNGFEDVKVSGDYSKITACIAKLSYLKILNKRTKDKKTQNVFMIIKRTTIKFMLLFLKTLSKILGKERKLQEKIVKNTDVYFSPFLNPPDFILKSKKIKRYTLLHDVIPMAFPEYAFLTDSNSWFTQLVNSINKDDYYFTNSKHTKEDFIKYIPQIDPEKMIVTYVGANENFYVCADEENHIQIRRKYNIPFDKKYIFSLCTLEPRKNLIFAVKNFIEFIRKNNIHDLIFVLGGGHWESFIDKLNLEIENLGEYKDKIVKAGYVDDEDLASLYSHAQMFVYPSFYEGFGSPPLEAMQCGCPLITSNVTAMPEVAGNAAILINPSNDKELIEAYEKIYFDENLRKELSLKGVKRAKDFSWEKSVKIMTDTIIKNSKGE